MIVRSDQERSVLRECGRRLAAVLEKISAAVRPNMATLELDRLAEGLIREAGGEPVFKGYRTKRDDPPFPGSLCISINDEVVHGIPRQDRILRAGDIIGLDIGMRYPATAGLITDMAVTVPVGQVSPQAEELIAATEEALAAGITTLRPGIWMGDLSHAIQEAIESCGFAAVRELVGHGVGRHLHEDPYVPNYGKPGDGIRLREGMVLAIEPMATAGSALVMLDRDGWTWRTSDGSLAAHFEHTVVVTKMGAEVLTKL